MKNFLKMLAFFVVLYFAGSYIEEWPKFEKYATVALVCLAVMVYQGMKYQEKESERIWNAINALDEKLNSIKDPMRDINEY